MNYLIYTRAYFKSRVSNRALYRVIYCPAYSLWCLFNNCLLPAAGLQQARKPIVATLHIQEEPWRIGRK